VRWSYTALGEVRTGILVSPWTAGDKAARPWAAFGDILGNVYVLDAATGALIWRDRPDAFPTATITATPTLFEGRLYVAVSSLEEASAADPTYPCCKFRGSIVAYDGATGRQVWRRFTIDQPASLQGKTRAGTDIFGPAGVAVWSSPIVDAARRQLLFATGDNYTDPATRLGDAVVALDLNDGHVKWAYQATQGDVWNAGCLMGASNCTHPDAPDFDFGAGVVLARTRGGRDLVLAGQKSGAVFAIDPADGRLVWSRRLGRGGAQGGVHFGLAVAGRRLFVPISDMPHGQASGPPHPGLYALDVATGRLLWSAPGPFDTCRGREFCFPGISAAISASPGLVYAGGMDGVLRVHDAATGKVLWRYDTTRPAVTVSGARASGGAMGGGSAPVVAGGMLFANSGYGANLHMPGNVLLAFEAP
jgi:polyvinyl alcohol dehydrogenase (cytochrome)